MNLQRITDRIHEAQVQIDEITHVEEYDEHAAVGTIVMIDDLVKQLGTLKSILTSEVLTNRTADTIDIGTHTATIKARPKKKSTDWPMLLPAALLRINERRALDEETGEMEPFDAAVARLLPDLVPMTGSVNPKSTGMSKLGFDPKKNMYVKVDEWSPPSLRIEPIETQLDGETA